MIQQDGLELAGTLPDNDTVYDYDFNGKPTIALEEDNPAVKAAFAVFDKIIP